MVTVDKSNVQSSADVVLHAAHDSEEDRRSLIGVANLNISF